MLTWYNFKFKIKKRKKVKKTLAIIFKCGNIYKHSARVQESFALWKLNKKRQFKKNLGNNERKVRS